MDIGYASLSFLNLAFMYSVENKISIFRQPLKEVCTYYFALSLSITYQNSQYEGM